MTNVLKSILCLALLATQAVAAEKPAELKTHKDRISYLLGTDMGKKMKAELERQAVDVDPEVLARGIVDVFTGKSMLMTDAELQELRVVLQGEIAARNLSLIHI